MTDGAGGAVAQVVRVSVTRWLAHEPFGWRPTTLVVTLRRYACKPCGRVWRQEMSAAAGPRARLSRRTLQTGAHLLSARQKARLEEPFADEGPVEVEATWAVYQRMVAAYRNPDRRQGRLVCNG